MMTVERRRAERVRVNLDVVYADQSRQHKGTISDISTSGCFILAATEEPTAEPITVIIELPSKKTVRLTGDVVYNTPEIGFAIHFKELPAIGLSFIEKLVKRFNQTESQPDKGNGQ
ncbi:MAG TPA: PilZ domain-containing protein [Pyrinomonadaceae bacterium]|jgi:hypothetical protein